MLCDVDDLLFRSLMRPSLSPLDAKSLQRIARYHQDSPSLFQWRCHCTPKQLRHSIHKRGDTKACGTTTARPPTFLRDCIASCRHGRKDQRTRVAQVYFRLKWYDCVRRLGNQKCPFLNFLSTQGTTRSDVLCS